MVHGDFQGVFSSRSQEMLREDPCRDFERFPELSGFQVVTGEHWQGHQTKESIDQIDKNCPKDVRKLCFQPLQTIFWHFSDIFLTYLFWAVQRFARYNGFVSRDSDAIRIRIIIVRCERTAKRPKPKPCETNALYPHLSLLVFSNRSWKCLNEGNFTLRFEWRRNAATCVPKEH